MIKFLKQPKYLFIFSLALILGILTFFYYVIRPRIVSVQPLPLISPPKAEKPGAEKFNLGNFKFIGASPKFPKEAKILKTKQVLNGEELSQTIAQKLTLEPVTLSPGINNLKRWQNKEFILSYLTDRNIIKIETDLSSGEKPNLNSAQESSKQFLSRVGLWQDSFEFDPKQTQYFFIKGFEYSQSANPVLADLIRLYYQQKINSLPVFQTYSEDVPLKTEIGPNNSVFRIEYSPSFTSFDEFKTYPLISLEEAVQELNLGKGSLITLNLEGEVKPLTSKTVTSANLSQAKLVYLYSPGKEYLVPYFIFSGTAVFAENRNAEITVLIPAISDKYLIPGP